MSQGMGACFFCVTNLHPMRMRACFNICTEFKMADSDWDKFVAKVLYIVSVNLFVTRA